MTLIDIQRAASENLVSTYFQIALASPGVTQVETEGYRACLGDAQHPICNLAFAKRLDPISASRLREIAMSRRVFNTYILPNESPDYATEVLTRAGFSKAYELVQMVAEPRHVQASPMDEAETFSERLAVGRFMVDQFFPRQSAIFRQKIADATAEAHDLSLYSIKSRGGRVGAVMLSRNSGMIGLYNLCVHHSHRGIGIGSRIVRWCLSQGVEEEMPVTLQCNPSLRPWYEAQGFKPLSSVYAYSLPPSSLADIMETTTVS